MTFSDDTQMATFLEKVSAVFQLLRSLIIVQNRQCVVLYIFRNQYNNTNNNYRTKLLFITRQTSKPGNNTEDNGSERRSMTSWDQLV